MVRRWQTGGLVAMADDDLRFGDVGGGGEGSQGLIPRLIELALQLFVLLVILYALWQAVTTIILVI